MTETMIRPTTLVSPPPVKPRGTLLDVAQVSDGVGWLDTEGMVESYNCLRMDSATAWPCPPVQMAAPTSSASSTATTGGTLPAGTYRAKITAINDRGETVGSTEQSQTTTGSTSTVTFNWGAVSGATSYRVYLTNGAANSEAIYVGDNAPPYVLTSWPPSGSSAGTVPTSSTATVSVTKTFNPPGWQDGFRFNVYGGITCKGPGPWMEAAKAKVRAAFEAMESVGVERALMTQRFVASSGNWPAPTDITPSSGAVPAATALALLEGDAACKYAGQPIIHMPRTVASLLAGVQGSIHGEGNRLITELGTPVAAGGGYGCPNQGPTGAAPAAGELWVYASGQVMIQRGETLEVAVMDQGTNDQYVLVERAYVGAVDCYASAVRVKVT